MSFLLYVSLLTLSKFPKRCTTQRWGSSPASHLKDSAGWHCEDAVGRPSHPKDAKNFGPLHWGYTMNVRRLARGNSSDNGHLAWRSRTPWNLQRMHHEPYLGATGLQYPSATAHDMFTSRTQPRDNEHLNHIYPQWPLIFKSRLYSALGLASVVSSSVVYLLAHLYFMLVYFMFVFLLCSRRICLRAFYFKENTCTCNQSMT